VSTVSDVVAFIENTVAASDSSDTATATAVLLPILLPLHDEEVCVPPVVASHQPDSLVDLRTPNKIVDAGEILCRVDSRCVTRASSASPRLGTVIASTANPIVSSGRLLNKERER
jgi:hypothetical protein